MYTTVSGPKGTIRYKKGYKFVKKTDIPADILIKLQVGMNQIEEIPAVTKPEVHTCIFCGMVTKQYRLLNQQPVYVCNNDYYDRTIGQIAQQVRVKEQVNG